MSAPLVYLDTSVVGGYFDQEWMHDTRELWRQRDSGIWRFVASGVVLGEVERAPKDVLDLFTRTFTSADDLLLVSPQAHELATSYIDAAISEPGLPHRRFARRALLRSCR